ncbi:NAD(P)-dependent oxidoreductase [Neolewinella lacunae]|uniref:Saccharopine dehydrogenase [NAD(+), L-lysine-forming] n=1 Tax=Neolewinella lacunae TaxID=1517758 RepID=A0A923T9B8_9BACT|nr:NAD(P)-dependent oxidoreductase [Neolewinella lacunae]MBC6995396.1 alanine dehydrogenase [Neolewinella lacunae]MDN3633108.1 NAD(P)-dependent oxidoreductase [Neolewinella lacunae]
MPYPSIAVIREGKTPPDSRTPLTPAQVKNLRDRGLDIVVQPSPGRIFVDEEYRALGIPLQEDLSDRQLLLGIKEVPISQLIPGKMYCFFAHVGKKQSYNQPLLRALLDQQIHLLDYEYFTDAERRRLIAFGYWAGMVGAHNAIWTYAQRTGTFTLPRLKDLFDYAAAKEVYAATDFPPLRVVLTGSGRVGMGAGQVLLDMGFEKVTPQDYLAGKGKTVFTRLHVTDYAKHPNGQPVDKNHFYRHGEEYQSNFGPYAAVSDVFINGIFWDGKAPAFFTPEEMRQDDFRIQVIGDITCDIAPDSSVPSTLFASTIADPVFGYDPHTERATAPYGSDVIDVMSIDNLPSELPRDASSAFGEVFIEKILPEFARPDSDILERATITRGGQLGPEFGYLKDFADRSLVKGA